MEEGRESRIIDWDYLIPGRGGGRLKEDEKKKREKTWRGSLIQPRLNFVLKKGKGRKGD